MRVSLKKILKEIQRRTVKLKPSASPASIIGPEVFYSHLEDGKYQGIPERYFEVGRNKIRLDPKVAKKIVEC